MLLFEIGLETDLQKMLKLGGAAMIVAIVGVIVPFALDTGFLFDGLFHAGLDRGGAALTATSVGITARVLSDLHRLQEPESQIILGAAVIDDVIGLVILAIVSGLTQGEAFTLLGTLQITLLACGFLIGTLVLGQYVIPPLVKQVTRFQLAGTPTMLAVLIALGLAWLAPVCGSAELIGAFAAGLLLRNVPQAREIEEGVAHLGHFFVPIFFVSVGAAVDVRVLNPFDSANGPILFLSAALIVVATLGKFVAGYAPWWFRGKKHVIGFGMIPRGEVGLIFANKGLTSAVLNPALYSAVTITVMATTFIAPALLKLAFPPLPSKGKTEEQGIENLLNEP